MDREMGDSVVQRPMQYPQGQQLRFPQQLDPAALAKVKVLCNESWYVRTALKAIDFFNKAHQVDYEVVELVSGNMSGFRDNALWEHINFRAKPKNEANGNDRSLPTFFAELWYGPYGLRETWLSEGEITACSLLEEGSTKDRCGFCSCMNGVHHPLQGGYTMGI